MRVILFFLKERKNGMEWYDCLILVQLNLYKKTRQLFLQLNEKLS